MKSVSWLRFGVAALAISLALPKGLVSVFSMLTGRKEAAR